MALTLDRRKFLVGTALAAALPRSARAQSRLIRIGLLTGEDRPARRGAASRWSRARCASSRIATTHSPAARSDLVVADTGGNPAGTKTKTQELVEREHVDMIFGPLAAFELLAITDYTAQVKTPVLSLAAAEDMTQRRPNPYYLRASATSAQKMHPLADYAAKELKFKSVITVADDFAFGHEQMGGFQQAFENAGGRVLKKLWPPSDSRLHAVPGADQRLGRRRAGLRRIEPAQVHEAVPRPGLKLPVVTGGTGGDDALLRS